MNGNSSVPCAYCGTSIAPGTESCPSCGAPAPPPAQPGVPQPQAPAPGSQPGFGAPPGGFGAPPGGFGSSNPAPGGFGSAPQGYQGFGGANQQQGGFGAGPVPPQSFGMPPPPSGAPRVPVSTYSPTAPQGGANKGGLIGVVITVAVVGIGIAVATASGGNCSGCTHEEPQFIDLNSVAQGELTTFHTYRLYELNVVVPTTVMISASSSWDNYLELYLGDSQTPMLQNDDGGPGLNAQITGVLTAGTYYILVRPFSEATGPFTLTVTGQPLTGRGF